MNNISLFFSDATVDIAMPSPCTASSHAISVKGFRWRTRSDHVTRNALAARNNEAYGQGKTADSGSVQSFPLLKTLDMGILLLAVFTLELETDYPSETSLCTVAPFLDRHPLSDFFFCGEGATVHRLSGTDNPVFKLSVEVEG